MRPSCPFLLHKQLNILAGLLLDQLRAVDTQLRREMSTKRVSWPVPRYESPELRERGENTLSFFAVRADLSGPRLVHFSYSPLTGGGTIEEGRPAAE